MRSIKLTSRESAADDLTLYMLYPEDEVARRQAFIVGDIHRLANGADTAALTLSVGAVRELLDAPRFQDILEDQRRLARDGMIAGDILAVLYVMHCMKLQPTMNLALWVVSEWARAAKYHDGTKVHAAEPRARDCWNRFRAVAPLWAACCLNRDYPFAPNDKLVSEGNVDVLLSVAAGIQHFGTSFEPPAPRKEKRVPLLDPETTWRMPDGVMPRILNLDELPGPLIETLKKYGKRRSRFKHIAPLSG